ncbi:DUF4385 family protein [Natrinema gelatinilyticum]|uniref:DUF4385 family protein n=1 Tax=Natrinema gelatinilyticum TaxID=2961571 RepID=UPI0020C3CC11|nr:DUF4385 family protein [Natrinema gelatinilyticum]
MSDDGPEYDIDFRDHPEKYEIGRGEAGVFKVEPYKSELLPLWSYADAAAARESATAIYEQYERYRDDDEFPGMDMARKYLRMGYTRAMRYAKYPGGRKYDENGDEREPHRWADRDKRAAALVFQTYWTRVRDDDAYQRAKAAHRER